MRGGSCRSPRVAATVTVIPRETIERRLVADVKELVRYEPGLSVRSDPFRFGLDTFAVRGVGGNRVAVEVDGIPAAGGFAVGSFSDSGRSFVDPAFLERVEVLRGPASSLYGSDAIGGVVAMTHARARACWSAPPGTAACAARRALRASTTAGTRSRSARRASAPARRCSVTRIGRQRSRTRRPT